MLLWEKMEKALEQHHKTQKEREEFSRQRYGDDDRKLERGDLFAMIVSAFLVIVPAVLLALLIIVGVAYFFFVR